MILAMVSAVLVLEISWPISVLVSGLDRREASERLWVLAPIVIVCWYLLSIRKPAQSHDHERNETDLRLRVADWLFVLFVVIHLAIQGNYANLRETFWMGFGTSVATATAVVFGALFVRLRHNLRYGSQAELPPNGEEHSTQWSSVTARLCVTALIVLAPYYMIGVSDLIDAYHSAWVINETMSWLGDQPAGLVAPIQYGSLVYAPVYVVEYLIGWATSSAVMSAFVWLSILGAIFLVCFTTVASMLVSSVGNSLSSAYRWVAYVLPGLAVVFMTQGTPTFAARNTGTILALLTAVPVRNVLPMVLLIMLLALFGGRPPRESPSETVQVKSMWWHAAFLFVVAITMLNNFEFGAPLGLAGLTIWVSLILQTRASTSRVVLALPMLGLVTLILFAIKSPTTGESYFSNWIAFSEGFGAESFLAVSMDEFGAHFVVIIWTFLSIIVGLKQLLFRRGDASLGSITVSIVMLYCGCWSLVCLAYFSGRSVPSGQLQSALVPSALLLLAWSLPILAPLLGRRERAVNAKSVVVSLLSLSLLIGSLLNIVDFGNRWSELDGSASEQVELLWGTYPEELADDILNENELHQPAAREDLLFVQIKYGNIFSHLTGMKQVGVLNGPDAIVTSERIRKMECTSIDQQLKTTPGSRVFVHKDSLPTLDKGLSPLETFLRLCPDLSQSVKDTETFLIINS
jgi:hypothetical protein